MVREWVAGKTSYHGPYLSALAMDSSNNGTLYKCPITLLYSTLSVCPVRVLNLESFELHFDTQVYTSS